MYGIKILLGMECIRELYGFVIFVKVWVLMEIIYMYYVC